MTTIAEIEERLRAPLFAPLVPESYTDYYLRDIAFLLGQRNAILALHKRIDLSLVTACSACGDDWPCATVSVVGGLLEKEETK